MAKSLSIVRRVCDIQPELPNQCGSAQLKQKGEQEGKKEEGSTWRNHLSAEGRGAPGLSLFSRGRPCPLSLFLHNKIKTSLFCG